MGDLSTYLANKLIDHAFRNTSYTPPATIYVALSTNGTSEISGNAYARAAVMWATAATKASDNSGIVTFATPTAAWGTITHVQLLDALTSGNALTIWKALSASKVVSAWDVVTFPIGDMDWTF